MFRSSFFWKLYAGYAFLILLTTFILILSVTPRIESESLKQIEASLRDEAILLRSLAAPGNLVSPTPAFQERIRTLGRETETRLTVIRADGVVVADSDRDPAAMENHRDRPEVAAARESGSGTARRYSKTLGREMLYLALPLQSGGESIGYVRTALPLTTIEERLRRYRGSVLAGALLAAAIGGGLGFLFTRYTTRPLAAMTAQVEALARDHSSAPVPDQRRDEIGRLARSFNTMADQLRERITRMERNRGQLLAILAGMREGVVAVDRDERILHLNRVGGEILEISPRDCLGKILREVSSADKVCEFLSRTCREGVEITEEIRKETAAGEKILQIHVSPLREADTTPGGAVAVLHDVTELRRLERVRRDFVANVSHELKTPVTAIRGLAETLEDENGGSEDLRKRFLEKIRRQSERLSSIVADLLALSRFESPDLTLGRERLDLRRLLSEIHNSHLAEVESKKIRLDLAIPGYAVHVLGDLQAVQQAVDNLVDNAIKYTPAQGRIRLRLRSRSSQAILEVEDTGIGISPGDQDRIFERFYRVDKARSRELGGTGLGLSIVKHIATVHGGEVSVESAPGKGSTFRIRLPLDPDTLKNGKEKEKDERDTDLRDGPTAPPVLSR